jgi:hypothetical protein
MPLVAGSAATKFLNQIDVGPGLAHRHGDHLDAEAFRDREVPVVAGRRGTGT